MTVELEAVPMIRLRRPAVAALGLLTLAAAVALPLWTLADGTTSHATAPGSGWRPRSPRDADGVGGDGDPATTDAGAVYLPGPIIKQDLALDCESAALQVALALRNIDVPQDRIFASLPQDQRPVVLGSDGYPGPLGRPLHGVRG